MATVAIAHTKNAAGQQQDLVDHLQTVADMAARFAVPFGAERLAYVAGILHDIGKFNAAFQQYLLEAETNPTSLMRGPDHKGAGAALASQMQLDALAFLVAGHHGGLVASSKLKEWLKERAADPAVQQAIVAAQAALPALTAPVATSFPAYIRTKHEGELFIRMLFSALVDADFLDTERHFSVDRANTRGGYADLASLERRFRANQDALMVGAEGPVNVVRREVYHACLDAAALAPGFFRLTVPTGGGKTRSSLAFALRHALRHDLRRVIYAIPYTSITEQTADEFRAIFGNGDVPLEHHSAITPKDPAVQPTPRETLARLAAENWDAPLIVTTTVQLFESLMARSTSACRKLHNIAGSVVILDEAQTLPTHLLAPIVDVLRQLVAHYGVSVVLCTATQPALDSERAGFPKLDDIREIVPDPERHFAALKRVEYIAPRHGERLTWEQVAEVVRGERQALVVVNTRADAVALLAALDDAEALHLSTWMCGAHRRAVLRRVRQKLRDGQPCRLISTQLIEAGVDVDFPVVLRALGPLDSIVQAAGRCNRNGRLDRMGRVIVFDPAEGRLPPGSYSTATAYAREELQREHADLHDPAVYRRYFERYYRSVALDKEHIQPLREKLDYEEVAARFRMIGDETAAAVILDYDEGGGQPAKALLRKLVDEPQRARQHLRALQPYIVSLRKRDMQRAVTRGLAEEMTEFPGLFLWRGRYDAVRGIDPDGAVAANGLIV